MKIMDDTETNGSIIDYSGLIWDCNGNWVNPDDILNYFDWALIHQSIVGGYFVFWSHMFETISWTHQLLDQLIAGL